MAMSYFDKAARFLDLSDKKESSDLSRTEAKEIYCLRRELRARGLNPDQLEGLPERALILDHRTVVMAFLSSGGKNRSLKKKLQRLRIDTNVKKLSTIISGINLATKEADKLKRGGHGKVKASKVFADRREAAIAEEVAADDAATAVATEKAQATMSALEEQMKQAQEQIEDLLLDMKDGCEKLGRLLEACDTAGSYATESSTQEMRNRINGKLSTFEEWLEHACVDTGFYV
ncbi:hypothetical protein IJV57_02465 [Candidatus Saccharibacteria bacterium]|nr:hypothetical protein [Candidatus Saccharibacteria bacterium]